SLLFDLPLAAYARMLPRLIQNASSVMFRKRARDFMDLPAEVDLESFPSYYRRNFHWQTDGYLSRRSAELYDVGVEMLFFGTGDVVRRQVTPPITRFLAQAQRTGRTNGARLLDVGCGTGRTLLQLARTHPSLEMYGIDLSPYYVDAAREMLRGIPSVQLL